MSGATLPFFTIGHSNRSLEDFVALLRGSDIARLVDVRTIPRSRFNPQFNTDTLPESLALVEIEYEHLPALGGRRGKDRTVAPEVNAFWTHESFHNYADYALSAPFRAGLEHLIEEGRTQRCAIMCSEAVWWRCHRRIITDYLLARDETVIHIMASGRTEPAGLTPGAVVRADRTVVYPPAQPSLL
ncbi:MAG TPA: DUF488 domain-containing protein [Vicinamibacterales bacterium]|jgi:uncharacterized protein (DUF488 family)|nr:DUF488 domain-containing protein [Vicinamibacterales bacterium]